MFLENIKKNKEWLDKYLNIDLSFDIGKREILLDEIEIIIYYVTGLVNTENVIKVINSIKNFNGDVFNNIPTLQVEKIKDLELLTKYILSGLIGILISNKDYAIMVDLREYPGRNPSEPDTERVIRGSRDGYTENIMTNLGLTRRRIRVGSLVNELVVIGSMSKTDVSITYIKGVVDVEALSYVKQQIRKIFVKELSMTDKALEELMLKNTFNPYPLVRYTERPDIVATHLYQGRIAIFVDNSPSVILCPTTIFDHLSNAEEYRQAPIIGTFLRFVRFLGIMVSIFLIPIWILIIKNESLIPTWMSFLNRPEDGTVPLMLQIIMALLGVELLRMASIHTPNSLSTAMGIIAAILLGDIAIDIGLFSKEVVLYVSVSQIGYYSTPSYEISLANKISSIYIILFTFFLGIIGFVFALLSWLIFLMTLKSFNRHYLYPLFPFNVKELMKTIIRYKKTNDK